MTTSSLPDLVEAQALLAPLWAMFILVGVLMLTVAWWAGSDPGPVPQLVVCILLYLFLQLGFVLTAGVVHQTALMVRAR